MKIDIYNDDKLQTITEFYYQDEPYTKDNLLVEFTLSTVMSDNGIKKQGFSHSKVYSEWIKQSKIDLAVQGFMPIQDKEKLYGDMVIIEIYYHIKQNKNGTPSNSRKDTGNIIKASQDLIQHLYQERKSKIYKTVKGVKHDTGQKKITIVRNWGYFIQDDKQVGAITPRLWRSKPKECMLIRIYKAKKLEDKE